MSLDAADGPIGSIPVPALTEEARVRVLASRDEDGDAGMALWVQVDGALDGSYSYELSFDPISEITSDDAVSHLDGDLTVVVPHSSIDELRGATLGLPRRGGEGLSIVNPNRPPGGTAGASPDLVPVTPSALVGSVEERVDQLLREHVNPSLAVHGGHVEMVAVEDDAAYLRLGGGCQGCGMAPVTLTQGIEVVLTGSVPEIDRIMDVTDHADGTNPFYESAKQ